MCWFCHSCYCSVRVVAQEVAQEGVGALRRR